MSAEPTPQSPPPQPLAASPAAGAAVAAKPRTLPPSLRAAVLVASLLAVGFAVWYFLIRTPEPKDDAGRFQGEWRVLISDGKDLTQGRAVPITIRVTGDRWEYQDKERVTRRYAMTLRPDANPKEIELVLLDSRDQPRLEKRDGQFVPITLHGIYEIERDQGKVFLVPGGQPRPTSFDADGAPVYLIERVK